MVEKPKFEDAPGIKIRARSDGTFSVYWQARHDLVKRGYPLTFLALWRGVEPSMADRILVSERCNVLQADMLTWARGGFDEVPSQFDGTVRGLIFCYTHDPHSPYRDLRYGSKKHYGEIFSRIERDHGAEYVRDLSGRDMKIWHKAWTERGVTMAHSLMSKMRLILAFGMTILEDQECTRLSVILSKMRFTMSPPRSSFLTAEMATAIRKRAHERRMPSVALAQAIQFEGMLRQKDIIGEWVPMSEPGPALVEWKNQKWQRGLLWSEIDDNLILRHVTSKRGKMIEIDLKLAPMVQEELALIGARPTFGPVIINDSTGRPWNHHHFREVWRALADDCGIPRTVQQRDTRAGAISEATDAGADIEHVRQAATHSNRATTERYSRNPAEKTRNVLQLRVAHRNKAGTT